VGRSETPGRPILYAVTTEFLHYFGLSSLAELPPLDLEEPEPPLDRDFLKG
jgi:segregation and condensation protein B